MAADDWKEEFSNFGWLRFPTEAASLWWKPVFWFEWPLGFCFLCFGPTHHKSCLAFWVMRARSRAACVWPFGWPLHYSPRIATTIWLLIMGRWFRHIRNRDGSDAAWETLGVGRWNFGSALEWKQNSHNRSSPSLKLATKAPEKLTFGNTALSFWAQRFLLLASRSVNNYRTTWEG